MKSIFYYITIAITLILTSCKKDEVKAYLTDNPTASYIVDPSDGSNIVLTSDQSLSTIMFTWKPSNYGFEAAVQYAVQVDVNSNFSTSKILTSTYSDTALVSYLGINNILVNNLKLPKGQQSKVNVRIRSFTDAGIDTLYSNPISLNVTTY